MKKGKSPSLDKEGNSGAARRVGVVRSVADEHGTPTTPAVAVGPGIPSSTEEGRLFSEELFRTMNPAELGQISNPNPQVAGRYAKLNQTRAHYGQA